MGTFGIFCIFFETGTVTTLLNFVLWDFNKLSIEIIFSEPVLTYCLSIYSNLEMSLDSTDEGEVQHYAYMVLRILPPFHIGIALLGLLTEPFLK